MKFMLFPFWFFPLSLSLSLRYVIGFFPPFSFPPGTTRTTNKQNDGGGSMKKWCVGDTHTCVKWKCEMEMQKNGFMGDGMGEYGRGRGGDLKKYTNLKKPPIISSHARARACPRV